MILLVWLFPFASLADTCTIVFNGAKIDEHFRKGSKHLILDPMMSALGVYQSIICTILKNTKQYIDKIRTEIYSILAYLNLQYYIFITH